MTFIRFPAAAIVVLCTWIGFGVVVQASTIDILLSSDGGGGTSMTITGSGADHNGTADGLGASSSWANLNGGDPFDISLENATFSLASPLAFTGAVDLVSMTFDHDGVSGSELQDDFTIGLSGLFDFDFPFAVSGTTTLMGLDFSLLNPGVYVRENNLAELTLTIAAVPLPAPVLMLLGPLLFLYRNNHTRK